MEYVSLASSSVAAVAYDDASSILGVRFVNGREYHYTGVPREVYDGFFAAPSIGRYFDENVKKSGYPHVQIG